MEGNVTAFEQQALKALNQIAAGIVNSQEETALSWLEKWAPLIGPILSVGIAVVGWWFIDRSNRRSNRDAFRLQLADAARNRILDALYDYRDFLIDARRPARVFVRYKSIRGEVTGRIVPSELSEEEAERYRDGILRSIRELAYFDQRQLEWDKATYRDTWALGPQAGLPDRLGELRKRHEAVVYSLFSYEKEVTEAMKGGIESGMDFLVRDRDEVSLRVVEEQLQCVKSFMLSLQKPLENLAGSHNTHLRLGGWGGVRRRA
jgi:hypothetical protein